MSILNDRTKWLPGHIFVWNDKKNDFEMKDPNLSNISMEDKVNYRAVFKFRYDISKDKVRGKDYDSLESMEKGIDDLKEIFGEDIQVVETFKDGTPWVNDPPH